MLIRFYFLVTALWFIQSLLNGKDSPLSIIDEQWELRAKIGASKLNDLIIELESLKMPHRGSEQDGQTVLQIAGRIALESAYAHHKKLPKMVQKAVEDGKEYHLILNAGERGLFDLVYVYSESGEIKAANIQQLPNEWSIRISEGEYPLIFVTTHLDESYSFDLSRPFTAVYWGSIVKSSSPADTPIGPTGI